MINFVQTPLLIFRGCCGNKMPQIKKDNGCFKEKSSAQELPFYLCNSKWAEVFVLLKKINK
jgi:hypothetical protein